MEEQTTSLNSFMIYNSGQIDAALENITKIFNNYNQSLKSVLDENIELKKKIEELTPTETKAIVNDS